MEDTLTVVAYYLSLQDLRQILRLSHRLRRLTLQLVKAPSWQGAWLRHNHITLPHASHVGYFKLMLSPSKTHYIATHPQDYHIAQFFPLPPKSSRAIQDLLDYQWDSIACLYIIKHGVSVIRRIVIESACKHGSTFVNFIAVYVNSLPKTDVTRWIRGLPPIDVDNIVTLYHNGLSTQYVSAMLIRSHHIWGNYVDELDHFFGFLKGCDIILTNRELLADNDVFSNAFLARLQRMTPEELQDSPAEAISICYRFPDKVIGIALRERLTGFFLNILHYLEEEYDEIDYTHPVEVYTNNSNVVTYPSIPQMLIYLQLDPTDDDEDISPVIYIMEVYRGTKANTQQIQLLAARLEELYEHNPRYGELVTILESMVRTNEY